MSTLHTFAVSYTTQAREGAKHEPWQARVITDTEESAREFVKRALNTAGTVPHNMTVTIEE